MHKSGRVISSSCRQNAAGNWLQPETFAKLSTVPREYKRKATSPQMSSSRHIRTTRRAIYGSLLVWMAVQFTLILKPFGVPAFVPGSLVMAGLVAFPVFLLWPWLKDSFLEPDRGNPEEPIPEDPLLEDQERNQYLGTLVRFEVLALCAMLLLILCYL